VSEQLPSSAQSRPARGLILAVLCLVLAAVQIVIVGTTDKYAGRDLDTRDGARVTADPSEIDRLKSGLQAADPVARVESAAGLLRLGLIEAGDALLEVAAGPEGEGQRAAVAEFGRVAKPMGEAVGFILDWPASDDTPPTAEQIKSARYFWEQRANPTLLLDVQDRLAGGDLRWAELDRASVLRDWLHRASDGKSERR